MPPGRRASDSRRPSSRSRLTPARKYKRDGLMLGKPRTLRAQDEARHLVLLSNPQISIRSAKYQDLESDFKKLRELKEKLDLDAKQQTEAVKSLEQKLSSEVTSSSTMKSRLEEQERTHAATVAQLQALTAELSSEKSRSAADAQRGAAGFQSEAQELREQKEAALRELKLAEDSVVMQAKIELDTPPEQEWETQMIAVQEELKQTRQTASMAAEKADSREKELVQRVGELTRGLEDAAAEADGEKKKQEVTMKEKALELESVQNKIKEFKLDAVKAKSILDRKDMEITKLGNIIKQLEVQKADAATAVLGIREKPCMIDDQDGGEHGDPQRRPRAPQDAIQGTAEHSPKAF